MKINVFGCSWSHGCKGSEDFIGKVNWVKELAKKYPQHQFYNYSLTGSSIEFSLAQLARVKDGLNIFQITTPFRFFVWDQKVIDRFFKKDENLFQYNTKAYKSIECYTLGNKPNKYFHKMYFTKQNEEAEKSKFLICCDYIKRNTDFCFFHNRFNNITDFSIPCIKEELGEKSFKRYSWDKGDHFNEEGCQWVANWIDEKINIL